MSGAVPFHPLSGAQVRAVVPSDSVWLSASAGTGKTQVLTFRVLRLLLEPGVRPEQILCLTFTKAGAAEMANRVNAVLAAWVRMEPVALGRQLEGIGAANNPATRERARTLFASVLDCPGGGLRIETIHAFSQWLLTAFPAEAGIAPGTRPLEEGRDHDVLTRAVLADCVARWQKDDPAAIAELERLSVRHGPEGARKWLKRCAAAGLQGWQLPLRDQLAPVLGLPVDAEPATFASLCADDSAAIAALRELAVVNRRWNTATGRNCADAIDGWLALSPVERFQRADEVWKQVFTKIGTPQSANHLKKHCETHTELCEQIRAVLGEAREKLTLLSLLDTITPALELGRRFAIAWEEAKAAEGLIELDDLIARAAALLGQSALADWIRYKLDRQFDHILLDEAQDTNAAQWAIIDGLAQDFFVGEGQADDRLRTLFVVGDHKQAIFGFQGTSPRNFAAARARYAQALRDRAANAALLRPPPAPHVLRPLQQLDLDRSYRSAQPILDFVDEAIAAIGPEALGLEAVPPLHRGSDRPGLVALWEPVAAAPAEEEPAEAGEQGGEEGAAIVTGADRRLADAIARQIRQWWDKGFPLAKGGTPRNATPGDFMVLVRKRKELASLIVARLHAAGVPVAGVDRLRLGNPLAVRDLLAALRFAAQPRDDLSLACLLVSPLIGWSQEQLLDHALRPERTPLWDHLRDRAHPDCAAVAAQLQELLARADFDTPQALLHWLLVGPWRGRARLLARLGREAGDPIDELLNTAFEYSATHTPSLAGFLRWFDAGEGEIKRENEGSGGVVRVMTVHGAKGLQAPIVILADACGDPGRNQQRDIDLKDERPGALARKVPVPSLRAGERAGRVAQARQDALLSEREEHWRLLYVAMTRAEEALFIGGTLEERDKGAPPANSWYARLAPLFTGPALEDRLFGARRERGALAAPVREMTQGRLALVPSVPAWASRPPAAEPRPLRPLAPSAAVADRGADPPLPPGAAARAATRGVIIHALLERLPDVPGELRGSAGRAWLARHGAALAPAEQEEMLAQALAVLDEPAFAPLFSPAALAEVPLAAMVGTAVITGTIDRLLIEPERVLVADFKTARRPPADAASVPASTLAQMAAYVAALEAIYPGRRIEAAVLYTHAPRLILLPGEMLAPHKPGLAGAE